MKNLLLLSALACFVLPIAPVPMNAKPPPSYSESRSGPVPRGPVVDGEQFAVRKVVDREQGGVPVYMFTAPERWRVSSQVRWNYERYSNPVTITTSVENPANAEAFFNHPWAQFFFMQPDLRCYGQDIGGLIYARPQSPEQTLVAVIRRLRGDNSELRVVGSKELADLPKQLRVPPELASSGGVGVKVTYELRGSPVEEEFYAVPYSTDIPYDGPQGHWLQRNWGLAYLHSFRAPRGTLDKRRAVFAVIAKSARPNPAWQQRYAAIGAYVSEQFNRQLQAGYDIIAAARRLSQTISANNDAMLAAIDHRMRADGITTARGGEGRSGTDKFDDYIRGVDTTDDPYYGTSQHAYTEQYHWTDGYGSYRNSNEPDYNPNQSEQGDWQLMEPTR